ncbi:gamma-glutamyltransferase [Pigmentiphaga sp. NML080357]|uniref:gamma-glutamyltransferase family protein n=1 Tax=Pigmentiphaga sp. NML080357 TaxID=2008675 RepID=UPI000B4079D7|nr:gamma-glutamyltransferase family protein [Pigmentiphaga sp. NML080357]OVZ61267.1 gamma-glutamyltransferase [Pigmentiphaga sp. NML080357]
MLPFDWKFPYPSQKMPLLAANAVTTSQPLAAQAGLRMLYEGGNAIDAALACAIALTVVEPVMNGIGGDMFALVWHEGRLHGLSSSGRSPAAWTLDHFRGKTAMPVTGWDAVTVPGQVAGWRALSERFGKLPFERLFQPALEYARQGFQVTPQIARLWARQAPKLANEPGFAEAFFRNGKTPQAGDRWRFPEQADTLQSIAQTRGDSFYRGALAQKIVDFARQTGGTLTLADLAAHEAQWVEPLSQQFRGYTLHEIPPSGQGIAALAALGMLERLDLEGMGLDSPAMYHAMIEAMKLAFSDLHEHIADPATMRLAPADLLDPAYLAQRAALIDPARACAPTAGTPKLGGTVYLAAADEAGTMVSFIQSNFQGFGSGVVVPGTGISLHNRGIGFNLRPGHVNCVGPSKKPLHTIIPGFVTRDGQPVMAFGVMGGSMQAQGHVQMMVRLGAYGQNPQAMSDAPRFRVDEGMVRVESHTPAAVVEGLRGLGHAIEVSEPQSLDFGTAQLIYRSEEGYIAASDSRRDGQAVGY